MSAELLNTLLNIQPQSIFSISILEVHDPLDCLLCVQVPLLVKLGSLFLELGISRVTVPVLKGFSQGL